MVDLYCERLGPGLSAEPINALTNVAFFIAAWAAWTLGKSRQRRPLSMTLLTGLVAVIGVGSVLFHTLATPWARVLDVAPILLFQLGFLWLYLRVIITATAAVSALAVIGLLLAALLGRQVPALLNGSVTYLPAFLLLIGLGVYHQATHRREPSALLLASGVFGVSLFFRAVDQAACPLVPFGTHFLWHLLNAVVLYLALRVLAVNWPRVLPTRA